MGQRRWTRLTNAFGRKWENQWAAAMLWYTYYNFCRIHKSLRVTPAMEAGITDHVVGHQRTALVIVFASVSLLYDGLSSGCIGCLLFVFNHLNLW